ncbi:uncharacterized protein BJ212DRAFT_718327 [Suillus subaureus]|uniref:Uncharacterized protein n=1 Tax=Suillus subaureus TaxID=48587 RepID=A0A9P7J8J2_9AGAM|nr:uncharacterized protein BJ212DRAFT_718327 [Suillus subaureus]KAG1808044.1 hypothetical protein BJ212DRAFT_718327 [Suillus subaureus]
MIHRHRRVSSTLLQLRASSVPSIGLEKSPNELPLTKSSNTVSAFTGPRYIPIYTLLLPSSLDPAAASSADIYHVIILTSLTNIYHYTPLPCTFAEFLLPPVACVAQDRNYSMSQQGLTANVSCRAINSSQTQYLWDTNNSYVIYANAAAPNNSITGLRLWNITANCGANTPQRRNM